MAQSLKNFKPNKEFFVGIDSDGCVFDSMEIKHKECFGPMFIKYFQLQAASKYAREVWEFVNLYSRTRGMNRFPALSRSLNLLRQRPEVIARKVSVPQTEALDAWISRENKLTNSTLKKQIHAGASDLQPVLEWSEAVNRTIEDIVKGVPPFPHFRESLTRMTEQADVIVVSQTPTEALEREWEEHSIKDQVRLIAGQESGTKTEHLKFAASGKYAPQKILMIGDAPGDQKAAKDNEAFFYPINPGDEEASWERFEREAFERFVTGRYTGPYEKELVIEFEARLPENPNWLKVES